MRFDGTSTFADARAQAARLDRCQHRSFVARRGLTEPGLFLTHTYLIKFKTPNHLLSIRLRSIMGMQPTEARYKGVRFPP
jgi:hypothetical protein